MKVVLISGSIRKDSYNTAIVKYLENYLNTKDDTQAVVLKGIDKLPYFSPDIDIHTLDSDNSPKEVQELRAILKSADRVILSTPEYAFEIPGVLKNALDWLVSSGEFVDKDVAVISSSTSEMGAESAYAVLIKLLKILSAKVYEDEVFNIGRVNKQIDEDGMLDNKLQDKLISFIESFFIKN